MPPAPLPGRRRAGGELRSVAATARRPRAGSGLHLIPLVQFLRADSTAGIRDVAPDSVLVEVGVLVPDNVSASLDSLQRLSNFHLGVNAHRHCSDSREHAGVLSRTECALAEYEHYLEVRTFVARDSAAEATIFVARRAIGRPRGRGVRASVASTVSKVVGKGTAAPITLSFRTFVAHLTLTDRGEWVVRDMVIPTRTN